MSAASAPPPPTPEFTNPTEECDLVMKGGITSGVVYPRVVIELARRTYRFRSIGGTSAGAIAAAVTAAAEYGRDKGGFQKLELVVDQLGQSGFLANLFQPAPELRPLLNTFVDYLEAHRIGMREDPAPGGEGLDGLAARALLRHLKPAARRTASQGLALLRRHAPGSIARGGERGGGLGARYGALAGGGLALVASLIALATCLVARVPIGPDLLLALAAPVLVFAALGAWAGRSVGRDVGAAAQVSLDTAGLLQRQVPANLYGICSGLTVDGHARNAVITDTSGTYAGLTDWLADTLDHLAGIELKRTPLTFGQLRYHKLPGGTDVGITLRMVTTNLSQKQPYVVPFESDLFLFSEQEMARLFPPHVVRHMVARARRSERLERRFVGVYGPPSGGAAGDEARQDWYIPYDNGVETHRLRFLPRGDDLPVVVGMRMSLSFPVLLSAVPLWSISGAAYAEQDQQQEAMAKRAGAAAKSAEAPMRLETRHLQRNWFSDGGICSNFPIHFFDRWFPPRPTFGINIDELPEQVSPHSPKVLDYVGGAPEMQDEDQAERSKYTGAVYMPRSYPHDWLGPRWSPLEANLPKFLRSILDTSLSYRDTMQSLLPSYADRIVTVRLTKREGGLNLNMDPTTIADITEKGARAGQEILEQFNLQHHQWVRLRLLLNELEEQMVDLRASIKLEVPPEEWAAIERQLAATLRVLNLEERPGDQHRATNLVQQLIADEREASARFPYPRSRAFGERESLRLNLLLVLIELWGRDQDGVFRKDGPRTNRLNLRVTPDL
ncbi:MAG: hypothetical protein RLZZ387_5156 [Chloroflexota bacterium]